MFKFKLGQRVTYLRLGKEGIITAVDAGLGYYLDCKGWTWSVPEVALSAKISKRYKTPRRRSQVKKAQPQNPNEIGIRERQNIEETGLKLESPCRQGDTPNLTASDHPEGSEPLAFKRHSQITPQPPPHKTKKAA